MTEKNVIIMLQCSCPYESLKKHVDYRMICNAFILEIKTLYIPCNSGCVSQD